MVGDSGETEARVVGEPSLDPEGVRVGLLVGELSVTVWFHDRSSDGAARGATPSTMRKAIQLAREYRRSNREAFERLFAELERRRQP
jgi:hypothetical protein